MMNMGLKAKTRTITDNAIDTKAQSKSEGKQKSKPKSKPIKRTLTYNEGPWNDEEHSVFEKSIKRCGTTWKSIAKDIGTRTPTQVRTHYQKTKKDKKAHEQAKTKSNIYKFLSARRKIAIEDIEAPNNKTIESGNKEEFKSEEHIRINIHLETDISKNLWNDVNLYAGAPKIKLNTVPELDRNMVILFAVNSLLNQLKNCPEGVLEALDPFEGLNGGLVYMEPDLSGDYLCLEDIKSL